MVLHKNIQSLSSTTSISSFEKESTPKLLPPAVTPPPPKTQVDVYRYDRSTLGTTSADATIEELKKSYEVVKVVHWIRHAQGYHNVGGEESAKSRKNIDARLTPHGRNQCDELARTIVQNAPHNAQYADVLHRTQAVVTSPVTRCIQTALLSLKPLLEGKPGVPGKVFIILALLCIS